MMSLAFSTQLTILWKGINTHSFIHPISCCHFELTTQTKATLASYYYVFFQKKEKICDNF